MTVIQLKAMAKPLPVPNKLLPAKERYQGQEILQKNIKLGANFESNRDAMENKVAST